MSYQSDIMVFCFLRQVSLNETVSFVMEETVENLMEDLTFLERKNKHNYMNGFKFQHLPLNFPLNILVKNTIIKVIFS